MIIYKIENKINGKIYIGQTIKELEDRISEHLKSEYPIGKAFRKYNINSFEISIIDITEIKEILDEKEKYWIKFYDCKVPNGYNLTDGGEGPNGYKHTKEAKLKISKKKKGVPHDVSEETRLKISNANKGRVSPMLGKHHSEETKQKISKQKGWKHTFETKEKLRHFRKKQPEPMLGKHHSEETKQKISKVHKGKKLSDETKQKISNGLKGRQKNEETKKKLSEIMKTKPSHWKGKTRTEENKNKISNTLKGHLVSEETRLKISNTLKNKIRK